MAITINVSGGSSALGGTAGSQGSGAEGYTAAVNGGDGSAGVAGVSLEYLIGIENFSDGSDGSFDLDGSFAGAFNTIQQDGGDPNLYYLKANLSINTLQIRSGITLNLDVFRRLDCRSLINDGTIIETYGTLEMYVISTAPHLPLATGIASAGCNEGVLLFQQALF